MVERQRGFDQRRYWCNRKSGCYDEEDDGDDDDDVDQPIESIICPLRKLLLTALISYSSTVVAENDANAQHAPASSTGTRHHTTQPLRI